MKRLLKSQKKVHRAKPKEVPKVKPKEIPEEKPKEKPKVIPKEKPKDHMDEPKLFRMMNKHAYILFDED